MASFEPAHFAGQAENFVLYKIEVRAAGVTSALGASGKFGLRPPPVAATYQFRACRNPDGASARRVIRASSTAPLK